jgi:rsbT co-antagonist protein RsbR
MSEITVSTGPDPVGLFENCPDPCVLLDGDEIVGANHAFRSEFGSVTSWRTCIDVADHDKLAGTIETSRKFIACPAVGSKAGIRMQWTCWRATEKFVCVRLDGLAGPEIPEAIQPLFTEPFTLAGMIAGKLAERMETTTWAIAKDGTILVSDGNALRHFGMQPGQIVGLNAFQIYPEGSTPRNDLEKSLIHGQRVIEEQVDTKVHWIRGCDPIRNDRGDITAMVGFAWCAPDLARELSQARALLSAVAKLPVAIWAMEPDGTCTLSVGDGLKHFGLKPGELVGKNLLQVYPPNSETHADILRSLQGESVARELRIGEMTWFSTILPVHDSLGQGIIQVFGVAENVTERSQAQRHIEEQLALIQSQQEAIAALTSPIIEVWQGVLVVPLIGSLDGDRAGRLLEHLLAEVVKRQSRAVILDLTGAQVVDPSTAQNLFDIMRSVRLLGAEGLVSGIRPNVARTMVELDIAGSHWRTFPTLAEALRQLIGKKQSKK